MVSVCAMNFSASHSPTKWDGGGRRDFARDLADTNAENEADFDPASITVQMSIWQELCGNQPSDNNQVSGNSLEG